jgi:flavorubredoxin
MYKVLILYYSRTGNTEKMAKAIEDRIKTSQEAHVELKYHIKPKELESFDAIIIGVPTYHHDMTSDMKNVFEEAAVKNINLKGKVGAAFGSYGWSGEAPRMALEIMKNKFEMDILTPPLLIKYTPDQTGLRKCREFGEKIIEKLMQKD